MTKAATTESDGSKANRNCVDGTAGLNLSILCHCSCAGAGGDARPISVEACIPGFAPGDALSEQFGEVNPERQVSGVAASQPPPRRPSWERGVISYCAEIQMPLIEPPLRQGEVWHMSPESEHEFEKVFLMLHVNGIAIKPANQDEWAKEAGVTRALTWSPFSLVQACRLHSKQADAEMPWLRLFKISVFQHGMAFFFAAQGEDADAERARWVADIARAIRTLTQSLFPSFSLCMSPVHGAEWTATRLLAGYMLLCNNQDVSLVYCELHVHTDSIAAFCAYTDEICEVRVMHIPIGVHTCVSDRVGIDCSCFSVAGHHFSARTCTEKLLWLRAISNVKVKLRYDAKNPTAMELANYRAAIFESCKDARCSSDCLTRSPLMPRRPLRRMSARRVESLDAEPGATQDGTNDQAEGLHKVPCVAVDSPASCAVISQTVHHTPKPIAFKGDHALEDAYESSTVSAPAAKSMLGVTGRACRGLSGSYCHGPHLDCPDTLAAYDGDIGDDVQCDEPEDLFDDDGHECYNPPNVEELEAWRELNSASETLD